MKMVKLRQKYSIQYLNDFQIKGMIHEVHKYSLLLFELVFFIRMATTTVEHQIPVPMISVAGLSFPTSVQF